MQHEWHHCRRREFMQLLRLLAGASPSAHCLLPGIATSFVLSLHVLLQGDDCSVRTDIHQCNITADSGTPLLFGKGCSSAMMPCLRHACCATMLADTNKGRKDALTIAISSTISNPAHTATHQLLEFHLSAISPDRASNLTCKHGTICGSSAVIFIHTPKLFSHEPMHANHKTSLQRTTG